MFVELEKDLCEITGYDNISFQPNRSVANDGYENLNVKVIRELKKKWKY